MDQARLEKLFLCSGVSAHMTGIKPLKEVVMTNVTVADEEIFSAKGVRSIFFETNYAYFTFTAV